MTLRACPHCGGPAKSFPFTPTKGWMVFCDKAGCHLGIRAAMQEEAEALWNARPEPNNGEELQRLSEMHWACSMRAIKRWQKANPGNDLVWPDQTDLLVWLLEQLNAERLGKKT